MDMTPLRHPKGETRAEKNVGGRLNQGDRGEVKAIRAHDN